MTLPTLAAAAHLAKALSPDEVAPGWTALLIVVALGVAMWFLWRSMNAHLRKVPDDFDEPGADTAPAEPPEEDDEPGPVDREQREQ